MAMGGASRRPTHTGVDLGRATAILSPPDDLAGESMSTDEATQASVTAPAAASAPAGDGPVRFLFVIARTRLDLFLTIRRRFLDDPAVHVLLDRRTQRRRSKEEPVGLHDRRRQPDRRLPRDYWEDPAHHPAVLIPLSRPRTDSSDGDARPSGGAHDKEPTMESPPADDARVLAWVQEGQHILQHVLPLVVEGRAVLKRQLEEATRRCQDLQQENDTLRAELARLALAHRQLERGRAEIVDGVDQLLAQMTQVLEPMRELADRLGQARPGRVEAEPSVG
jgi:hypothetical protein